MKTFLSLICLAVAVALAVPCAAVADGYRDFEALTAQLQAWRDAHPELLTLTSIGESRGGRDIWLATVAGSGPVEPGRRPALFIGANLEGTRLLGTEAALAAVEYLLGSADDEEIARLLSTRTFYVAPLLNPDVAAYAFANPLWERAKTAAPVNDDLDLEVDEDGPEDINGDGFITMMRVRRPDGEQIPDPDDPRLMREADRMEGEVGIYELMTEGIDNDGDGRYNEDPVGGVLLNTNFPHDYHHFADGSGLWTVCEPESIALVEFFINHRNIAAVFTFSGRNNLLNLQRGKGPASLGAERVKIPERMARFVGMDPEREYTVREIVEIVRTLPFARGMDITEEMVAAFLGLGPVMSIPDDDYPYFEAISDRYKEKLDGVEELDSSRSAAPATGDGSFITYAYFQYGVPAFTVDLWAVPEEEEEEEEAGSGITVDALKEMTAEEFLEIDEERIALFLQEQEAPANITPEMVINAIRGGMLTPERMAEMIEQRGGAQPPGDAEQSYILEWAAENVEGGGFIEWAPFEHPTLGEVEIGGMKPYVTLNPPYELVPGIVGPCAEFAVKLAADLPEIEITGIETRELSEGIYEVSAFVRNSGFFPTALRQGVTSRAVSPILLRLEVDDSVLLGGRRIHRIPAVAGHGVSDKFRWVVRGERGTRFELTATSVKSGSDSAEIVLD